MDDERARLEWQLPDGLLAIAEPTSEDVRASTRVLAAAYNEPHNRSMMGHDEMTEDDVVEHFAQLKADGARAFLFFLDGGLVGDGDLRGIANGAGELAIMIAERGAQGRGLGTRFAMMLHAFAFRVLRLDRVYVGIVPANVASRRLFEKLGYRDDASAAARSYADADDDRMMSIERGAFEAMHGATLDRIAIAAG